MSNIKYPNLRAEMARRNITIQAIAEELGVNRDSAGRKLSGKSRIGLDEAFKITRKFFPEKELPYLFADISQDQAS